ncbi:MAG: pilus assembly protein [Anaerolineae bacterium]|nr:pilus assembly protein [Anaerolineae bacterium]
MYREFIEKAQALVEYAFILVLVALVVLIILAFFGPTIGNIFSMMVVAI